MKSVHSNRPKGKGLRDNDGSAPGAPTSGKEQTSYPRAAFIGGEPPSTEWVASLPPEIGRDLYGERYDLCKLGVPFDLSLPTGGQAEKAAKAREYERHIYRPLIAKTQRAAAKLGRLLTELEAAHGRHPAEQERRRLYESSNLYAKLLGQAETPLEKSHDATQIDRALLCHWLGSKNLRLVGTIQPHRKGAPKNNERSLIEDALAAAGMVPAEIAKVTTHLCMEAPAVRSGDVGERVRKRLKRKGPDRT